MPVRSGISTGVVLIRERSGTVQYNLSARNIDHYLSGLDQRLAQLGEVGPSEKKIISTRKAIHKAGLELMTTTRANKSPWATILNY